MSEKLDHKALISRLPAESRRALCAQSDGPGLFRLGIHMGAVLLLGTAIASGVPGWPALLPVQGVFLAFLFAALHETIHRTAFASDWLNIAVAWIVAATVLLIPTHFRYFHFAHHRHTHDPARDPELATPKPTTAWGLAVHLSGLPDWRRRIRTLLVNAVRDNRDPYVPPRARHRVSVEARVIVAVYAVALALFWPVLIWAWLIPLLLGGPFLRAYLLAEHTFCPHVANMLANTRTTFTHRLVRWLAWNMPYHAEHHAYPAVPFHKLPAFHALAHSHLHETQEGYIPFTRDYLNRAETAHAP